MTNWADAIHLSDLAGAIDPPPPLLCERCGADLEDGQTGLCDDCQKKQVESELHSHDPRR